MVLIENPNTQRSIFLKKEKKTKKRRGTFILSFREPSVRIIPQRSEFFSQPMCLEVLFFPCELFSSAWNWRYVGTSRERENAVFKLLVLRMRENLVKCVPTVSLAKRYIGMRDRHFFSRIHQRKRKEKKKRCNIPNIFTLHGEF